MNLIASKFKNINGQVAKQNKLIIITTSSNLPLLPTVVKHVSPPIVVLVFVDKFGDEEADYKAHYQ